jgi:hypothetical protein
MELPRSSGQDICIPHQMFREARERKILVEVNSRDRNTRAYPYPQQFRWRFQRPLKDVKSITLCGGNIPTRIYNINIPWNQFTLLEGSTRFTITLNPGRYTLSSLSIELGSRINSTVGIVNQYSVLISPTSDQLTITRDVGVATFSLLFATGDYVDTYDSNHSLVMLNTPAKLMGFGRADYSDGGTGAITSPFASELDFVVNRLYVYINADNNQDIHTVERSVGRDAPFAIVYMNENTQAYKFFDKVTYPFSYSSAPAPITRMTTLNIDLRDEFNRLIDLNGRDFTILLEFTIQDEIGAVFDTPF